MDNAARIAQMKEKLNQGLQVTQLEIVDDSHKHVGHAGAASGAGHFTLKIAADEFTGKSKVAIHRQIYSLLGDMIPSEIHALSISVLEK